MMPTVILGSLNAGDKSLENAVFEDPQVRGFKGFFLYAMKLFSNLDCIFKNCAA